MSHGHHRIASRPRHGDSIGLAQNGESIMASQSLQLYLDDISQRLNDYLLGDGVRIPSYTVATLPNVPPAQSPSLIYVSDETGGAVVAFSDGTNWRRVTDRAIVS